MFTGKERELNFECCTGSENKWLMDTLLRGNQKIRKCICGGFTNIYFPAHGVTFKQGVFHPISAHKKVHEDILIGNIGCC